MTRGSDSLDLLTSLEMSVGSMPFEARGLLHSRGGVARCWADSHHRKSMGLNHPDDPDLTDAPL